jgi:hypothetical protein
MATFSLEVSHAQVAVFDPRLAQPFNDWTDVHVAQGFAWRPGSVSFSTLEGAGPIAVSVGIGRGRTQSAQPERSIAVPFSVPPHGEVEVATISASRQLQLAGGEYELLFSHGRTQDGTMWAELTFTLVESPVQARIVLADEALSPPGRLVMEATPA